MVCKIWHTDTTFKFNVGFDRSLEDKAKSQS